MIADCWNRYLISLARIAFCWALSVVPLVHAQTVKDREGAVRNDRKTLSSSERWIYNDFKAALRKGEETGKPVMVALRCIPCLACSGFDAQVLMENTELTRLLDQFVCVRLINANTLDLSLFQFDYDLSFSAMFLNGDGTIYGRFGSWAHQEDAQNKATNSMKEALEAVLSLHQGYPDNGSSLSGKKPTPLPYKTPVDIPGLSGKYGPDLNWNGKVVQSCVHCHQVGDAIRLDYRNRKMPIPDQWLFPFPQPEVIGLHLAEDARAKVKSVDRDSLAAAAGFKAGDEILTVKGQPLISIADFSWVLHNSKSGDSLKAEVLRQGKKGELTISLTGKWRENPDHTQRVGTWPLRGIALGGMKLSEVSDDDRSRRGLSKDQMALLVEHVGKYGKHAAAHKAGVKENDIIVACDNITERLTEKQLIARIVEQKFPGDKVKLTVRRSGKESEIIVPVQ